MKWYKTAQVIQSIATVLTIPLTSAVCSHAVVVYLQHCIGEQTSNVTLRQMLVLMDKGWTSIVTFFHLVEGEWRRYGSPFLVWAILLHLIGAIISPLLQIFISTETVKTPTYRLPVQGLPDISDKLLNTKDRTELTVGTTRKLLASASPNDSPSLLWSGSNNCTILHDISLDELNLCSQGGNSWSNILLQPDPFLSLLPKDFNTGLIQQFLPRFNFTAKYNRVTAEEFPKSCDPTQGALSISKSQSLDVNAYQGVTGPLVWELHACMPADLREPPWKVSRARQDFTEELYLNVSLSERMLSDIGSLDVKAQPYSTYIHITVDTTAGYFELPNYRNTQKAGPLLNDGPNCGKACKAQTFPEVDLHEYEDKKPGDNFTVHDLQKQINKGPLLATALALFSPDSWLDLAMRYPDLYNQRNGTSDDDHLISNNCVEFAPLGRILGETTPATIKYNSGHHASINKCILDSVLPDFEKGGGKKEYLNVSLIGKWLYNFRVFYSKEDADMMMAHAFTIAAYLANMAWVSEERDLTLNYMVHYDLGVDSQKPSISLAGIIVVSIFIGLGLLGLLATAIYASWFPRWTELPDAFSMLRLGSSIGEHVPLKVSVDDDEVHVLDELPGWIGSDSNDPEGESFGHTIGLGGPGRLQTKTAYEAYDGKTARKRARKLELNEEKKQKRRQISSV